MPNYLRAYHERADGTDSGPIRFIASTEAVARDAMVIKADAWQLENYRANPVVLWGHDYTGQRLPIGRADVEVDGNRLMADVTFDPGDEFAQQIERKYRTGFLSAVSVGWDTLESEPDTSRKTAGTVTRADLLDISAVPVPGDPGALKERQLRSLADMGRWLESVIEDPENDTPEDEAVWTGTAAAMVRLYLPDASESEGERQRTYKRLTRAYDRMGKTAPEYLPLDQVDALGTDQVRGLFLSGEADLLPEFFNRSAVLPVRVSNDVQQAIRLLQGVASWSTPTNEPDPEPVAMPDDAVVRLYNTLKGMTGND